MTDIDCDGAITKVRKITNTNKFCRILLAIVSVCVQRAKICNRFYHFTVWARVPFRTFFIVCLCALNSLQSHIIAGSLLFACCLIHSAPTMTWCVRGPAPAGKISTKTCANSLPDRHIAHTHTHA